jgi:DNA-binding XRE family transcriptional regulator
MGILRLLSGSSIVDLIQLGMMLRECRGESSIKSVARQLRISARTYRLAEMGRQRPQIRTCHALAEFLDKPSDEILARAGYEVLRAEDDNTAHGLQTDSRVRT